MDKVIIDGVDVSDCAYHRMNNEMAMCTACNSGVGSPYCEYHKDCYYKQLKRAKAELKKYEDMAKKGLEEFKDVGGCWGCGLQLQLNQDMEDIKKLKAENERLKKEVSDLNFYIDSYRQVWEIDKYKQALQEIKRIIIQEKVTNNKKLRAILDLITKTEEENE